MSAGYVERGPIIGGKKRKSKMKDPGELPRVAFREGWLEKKKRNDGIFSNWNRRFFRIDCDARKLGYFYSKADAEAGNFPTGSISLDSITAVRVHAGTEFLVESKERNFTLRADNENDALQWFNTLEGYRRKVTSYVAAKKLYEQQLRRKLKELQNSVVNEKLASVGHSIVGAAAAAAATAVGAAVPLIAKGASAQTTETPGKVDASNSRGNERKKTKHSTGKANGGLKRGSGLKISPRQASDETEAKAKDSTTETTQQSGEGKKMEEKKPRHKPRGEQEATGNTKKKKKILVRGGGLKVEHVETKEESELGIGGDGDAPKTLSLSEAKAADGEGGAARAPEDPVTPAERDFSNHQKAWATPTKSPIRRGSGISFIAEEGKHIITVKQKESKVEGTQQKDGKGDESDVDEDEMPPPPPPPSMSANASNAREVYAALATKSASN